MRDKPLQRTAPRADADAEPVSQEGGLVRAPEVSVDIDSKGSMSLGPWIRSRRKTLGLNQMELGERLHRILRVSHWDTCIWLRPRRSPSSIWFKPKVLRLLLIHGPRDILPLLSISTETSGALTKPPSWLTGSASASARGAVRCKGLSRITQSHFFRNSLCTRLASLNSSPG